MPKAPHTPAQSAASFWSRVQKADGCWTWTGGISDGFGYWKSKRAHKVAWQLTHGNVPASKVVKHTCGNSSCCNPAHMRLEKRNGHNAGRKMKPKQIVHKGNRVPALNVAQIHNIRERTRHMDGKRLVKEVRAVASELNVRPRAVMAALGKEA